jgi:hypothetical protein
MHPRPDAGPASTGALSSSTLRELRFLRSPAARHPNIVRLLDVVGGGGAAAGGAGGSNGAGAALPSSTALVLELGE